MSKYRNDVRFILDTDNDQYNRPSSYVTAKLSVCVINHSDGKDNGAVQNPGYFYSDSPDHATNVLNDLTISAQASTVTEDASGETPRCQRPPSIGWRPAR